jgi:subtilase family serine protease
MANKQSLGLRAALLSLAGLAIACPIVASAQAPASRLTGDWHNAEPITIPGSAAPTASDLGPAPASAQLDRVLLLLAPSSAQQQALTTELANLQSSSSPHYHQWLTSSDFAASYSNSASDVAAISTWLQSANLQVASLPAGRGWIEFSGSVGQIEQAFHAQIHSAVTTTGPRYFLSSSISVPAPFAPLVQGLVSLDGSLSTSALTTPQTLSISPSDLAAQSSLNQAVALTPQLLAPLLHLDTLHADGTTGSGETIAVAARSNINASDVAAFRSTFGLPASAPIITPDGPDPGLTSDQAAATLAVSWAGAAAPGVRILLVPAATTSATDGIDLALAAIVDQSLAHSVAVGYTACEAALSPAHQAFYAALYRQAAAEGIAIIAAAGDSGASACHPAGETTPVTTGLGVNALASTPWNTAVGVAAFTASGYSAWSPVSPADPAYAGGGGSSTLYAAPVWQPLSAQPLAEISATSTHNRLLPDLALPTAIDNTANPGLAFCLSPSPASTTCTPVRAGGSSASASLFAGIAALIAQQNGPQGNLAPTLYALSLQSGIFSDVTQGSAQLPCVTGTPSCSSNGQIGFTASAGYDLATGLGLVDAHKVVAAFHAQPAVTGTGLANVTNTTGPSQTINPSGSVTLSANVVSGTGGPAPTGTVAFFDQSTSTNVSVVALNVGSGETSTASVTITGVLTQGGHPIVAEYSGDSVYAPANSQPVVVEVQPSATTTSVAPSTPTPAPGSTFTVTATITSLDAGTGALPPSGTVDFRLDGVSQGVKQVVTGTPSTSSINMTAPFTAGSHQIDGFYSGDNNYTNSTSTAATITVAQGVPTVTLTPSTTTPLAGSSLTLTASISPPYTGATPPTGTVSFFVDGAAVGTATVSIGNPSTAALAITAPTTGTHTVTATYNGDTNYTSANSPAVTITVAKSATSLAITPSTTTPTPGASFTVTATLTNTTQSTATPTGTVTFTLDGTSAGVQTLTAGKTAVITLTAPTSGAHTLQASYSGDSNFLSSTSPSVTITVAKIQTTTALTPSTSTPTAGSPVTVTAAISPSTTGTTPPTGTITFTVDGTSAGVQTVVSGSPSTASISLSSLTSGAHIIVGTYSGDTNYAASTSPGITVTVGKSPTTTVVTPATLTPTAGGSLLVTASITSSSPVSTNPTGTVTFNLDGVAAGTATVTTGLPASATFTIPIVTAGPHTVTATFSGDTAYAGSTSAAVAITAAKGATITTVTATPPILSANSTETLTATIAPATATTGTIYNITGTVSFYDGGTTLLGTAVVTSNTASLPGVALANNVGHSITAIYSGDTNWLASTSVALPLAATTLPDTVVLTANDDTTSPGQAVVLTVTVTPSATPAVGAEQNPTGNVVFYDGTTVIGTGTLAALPNTYASTAALTIQNLPGGQDVISAFYAGDLYYDSGTSNLLNLDVEDFTITPSPTNPATNLNIVQGSSGSASFVITGLGGFNNEVQIVCAVPSQDDMTCTATPQQITPTGTVTFVVQTFSSGGSTSSTITAKNHPPIWPRAAGGVALALLGFFCLPYGRRVRIFTNRATRRLMILVLLLVGIGGAGIGCSGGSQLANFGTPLGVATLKITANSYIDNTVVSHSVFLTVNVLAPGSTP